MIQANRDKSPGILSSEKSPDQVGLRLRNAAKDTAEGSNADAVTPLTKGKFASQIEFEQLKQRVQELEAWKRSVASIEDYSMAAATSTRKIASNPGPAEVGLAGVQIPGMMPTTVRLDGAAGGQPSHEAEEATLKLDDSF